MFSSYYMDRAGHVYPNRLNQDDVRVMVISPEDREQVERLRDALPLDWCLTSDPEVREETFAAVQVALREFAAPKPPKPEEPTGLGAVVVDRDGSELVRVSRNDQRPWRAEGGHRFSWDEIDFLAINAPGAEQFADWEIDLLRGGR